MPKPTGFSWIEPPLLAASAMPYGAEELVWLRGQGIDILLSLSEEPPPHRWIDDAGLMLVHVPVPDFEAPTQSQFEKCLSIIQRGFDTKMGVNVHCHAGKGRTGTVLAAYFAAKGMPPRDAIQHVRNLRPGSIETPEQEQAILEFIRTRRNDPQE
jgi:atypical dual specificity phosphatase